MSTNGKPWPSPGRIACVVLGCRRTAPQDRYPGCTQIICGKCFHLASQHLRRRCRRIERLMRKLGARHWHDTKPNSPGRRALILQSKVFGQIVASATERKVGITA